MTPKQKNIQESIQFIARLENHICLEKCSSVVNKQFVEHLTDVMNAANQAEALFQETQALKAQVESVSKKIKELEHYATNEPSHPIMNEKNAIYIDPKDTDTFLKDAGLNEV